MKKIRQIEKAFYELFCDKFKFSENLYKREDNILKDKYDNNVFEYVKQFSKDEFIKAFNYQKDRGDDFIKFEGHEELNDSFDLEESVSLTLLLMKTNGVWKINKNLIFKKPKLAELINLEVKHYKDLYGESFTRRNVIRLYEKVNYLGAYINNKLVGSIYYFIHEDYICMDGLLVDIDYRNNYVATSLLNEIVSKNVDKKIFLHADDDDSPKDIYLNLDFEIVDKTYEYSLVGLNKLVI